MNEEKKVLQIRKRKKFNLNLKEKKWKEKKEGKEEWNNKIEEFQFMDEKK